MDERISEEIAYDVSTDGALRDMSHKPTDSESAIGVDHWTASDSLITRSVESPSHEIITIGDSQSESRVVESVTILDSDSEDDITLAFRIRTIQSGSCR